MPEPLHPDVVTVLEEVGSLPSGPAQVAKAQEALETAQRLGGFHDELAARLELVSAAFYVQRPTEHLSHFAWLRTALDHPEGPAEHQRDRILWFMKWGLSQAIGTPDLPLSTVEAMLNDVSTVYQQEGFSLRPIIGLRAELAQQCGDDDAVDRLTREFERAPRDSRSDCQACETVHLAYLTVPFETNRAIEAMEPVLSGGLSCAHEPHVALGRATLWAAIGDQPTLAMRFHRRGWPLVDQDRALMGTVARHLIALAALGETATAMSLLADRWNWMDDDCQIETRLWWHLMVACVLRVAPTSVGFGGRPAREVAEEAETQARQIADRFDTRNGSTFYGDLLDRYLAITVPAATEEPAAPGPAGTESRPQSVDAYAEAVRTALHAMDTSSGDVIDGWLQDRERLLQDSSPSPASAYLDRIAAHGLEPRAALPLLEDAQAAAGSDPVQTWRIAMDLALLRAASADGTERSEEIDRAVRAAEELQEHDATAAASAQRHLTDELTALGAIGPEERAARMARAAELYATAGEPQWQAATLLTLAALQEGEESSATLEKAAALVDPTAPARLRAMLATVQAEAAFVRDDLSQARRLAQQVCDDRGDTSETLDARDLLTRLAVEDGDWEQVEAHARMTVRIDEECGGLGGVTIDARSWLGIALFQQGHHLEAAHWLETVLPDVRAQRPVLLGQTAWALGNALAAIDENADARTTLALAATAWEAEGNPAAALAQYRAGRVAAVDGDLPAAEAHVEAAIGLAEAAQDLDTLVGASRLLGAVRSESAPQEALAILDALPGRIREVADRAGFEVDPADLDAARIESLRQGAWVVVGQDTPAAVNRIRQAVADATAIGWPQDGLHALRCDLIAITALEPSLLSEAVTALRREAAASDEEPDDPLIEAAFEVLNALVGAGRHEEARSLGDELGFE